MFSVSKIALVLLFVTVVYSASIQKREIQDNDITKRDNNEDVQKAIDDLSGGHNNDVQNEDINVIGSDLLVHDNVHYGEYEIDLIL